MRSEPRWLDADALADVDLNVVAETGEPHLTLDRGLLESAAARPVNLWLYEDGENLVHLASSLLFGIARNHPFREENNQIAWVAFVIMLELIGLHVHVKDADATAQAIVDVITGAKDQAGFWGLVAPFVYGRDSYGPAEKGGERPA